VKAAAPPPAAADFERKCVRRDSEHCSRRRTTRTSGWGPADRLGPTLMSSHRRASGLRGARVGARRRRGESRPVPFSMRAVVPSYASAAGTSRPRRRSRSARTGTATEVEAVGEGERRVRSLGLRHRHRTEPVARPGGAAVHARPDHLPRGVDVTEDPDRGGRRASVLSGEHTFARAAGEGRHAGPRPPAGSWKGRTSLGRMRARAANASAGSSHHREPAEVIPVLGERAVGRAHVIVAPAHYGSRARGMRSAAEDPRRRASPGTNPSWGRPGELPWPRSWRYLVSCSHRNSKTSAHL
jgi:hypothetical protein